MTTNLKFTAVLMVLNPSELIASSLRHLRSMDPDEIIFVDGGSDDGTLDFLRGESGVKLVEMPGEGIISRLFAGAEQARNEHVLVLADDDVIPPGETEAMLRELENRPELAGLQFKLSAQTANYWGRAWNTYFSIITRPGKKIPLLGRPCVTKKANLLGFGEPPDAFGDDTWIHLQEVGKNRLYEVGPGSVVRSCPNTAAWNAAQFQKYGEADNKVSANFRQHVKLLFHTAVRISLVRSCLALTMGKPAAIPFIMFMGVSRTYHHLNTWSSTARARRRISKTAEQVARFPS